MEVMEQFASESPLESDATLLHDFANGHPAAFELLFRQFQGDVHGWITRIIRDPTSAEDLTIETFWRIHKSHARFDPKRNFGAWARRIATNVALDYLKTRKIEVELPSEIFQQEVSNPAVTNELRQKIKHIFRTLPPKLQAAAALALIEERSYEEIAEALGISVGAVKSRIFRAVRALRKKLERQGITP